MGPIVVKKRRGRGQFPKLAARYPTMSTRQLYLYRHPSWRCTLLIRGLMLASAARAVARVRQTASQDAGVNVSKKFPTGPEEDGTGADPPPRAFRGPNSTSAITSGDTAGAWL